MIGMVWVALSAGRFQGRRGMAKGLARFGGYTEPLLHAGRLKVKAGRLGCFSCSRLIQ